MAIERVVRIRGSFSVNRIGPNTGIVSTYDGRSSQRYRSVLCYLSRHVTQRVYLRYVGDRLKTVGRSVADARRAAGRQVGRCNSAIFESVERDLNRSIPLPLHQQMDCGQQRRILRGIFQSGFKL